MEFDAFRYDFTKQELIYLLFKKKSCIKCGSKMKKIKNYEAQMGSDFNSKRGYFPADNDKVKHYVYSYKYSQCGSQFTLQGLANMKG